MMNAIILRGECKCNSRSLNILDHCALHSRLVFVLEPWNRERTRQEDQDACSSMHHTACQITLLWTSRSRPEKGVLLGFIGNKKTKSDLKKNPKRIIIISAGAQLVLNRITTISVGFQLILKD